MDKKRRGKLKETLRALSEIIVVIEQMLDKEQECLDNTPENLENSERYERMEDVIDCLQETLEKLEEAKTSILNATLI